MVKVLCVGAAVQDNIYAIDAFPKEPTKVFASRFAQVGGGPAANGAVTVRRMGGEAELWARTGGDHVGKLIVEELAQNGVDVSFVRRVEGKRSAVSTVMIDNTGDRFIAAFADRTIPTDASWLPLERIGTFDAVLCDVRWPAAAEIAMQAAQRAGVPVVLDADLTDDDAVGRLLPHADYAVFSAAALSRFAGTDDPEAGLAAAARQTPGFVGVTLGADGFLWLEDSTVRHQPAFAVEALDTLGAGDVFHGAFALGVAEGMPIGEIASLASAAAALKCTRWGGRSGIPDRAAINDFMRDTRLVSVPRNLAAGT
jgi:sulfofructose kinase